MHPLGPLLAPGLMTAVASQVFGYILSPSLVLHALAQEWVFNNPHRVKDSPDKSHQAPVLFLFSPQVLLTP